MPSFLVSPDDAALMHGFSAQAIADILGVSERHARRYKSLDIELPEPCRRLLRFRRDGDISSVFGQAWAGFVIKSDGLHLPSYPNKGGFSPSQISFMFYTFQFQATLKDQVRGLESKVWAMDKVREAERNGSRMARIQEQVKTLQAVSAALLREIADDQTLTV